MDLGGIEQLLFSGHMMLAAMLKEPSLALDQKEAESLAQAAASVAAHYDFTASAKSIAWAHLITAAAMIYVPRGIVLARTIKEKHPAKKPAETQVHVLRPIDNGTFTG